MLSSYVALINFFAISSCLARGNDSNYDIYQIWLAIKYFWGPQGPTTLGCFPSDAAQTVGGQAAKDLKQCHIDKHRTAITQCLKLRGIDDST